jgi:hypothetical protein
LSDRAKKIREVNQDTHNIYIYIYRCGTRKGSWSIRRVESQYSRPTAQSAWPPQVPGGAELDELGTVDAVEDSRTVITPTMLECTEQKNGNEPGVENTYVKTSPITGDPEVNRPSATRFAPLMTS